MQTGMITVLHPGLLGRTFQLELSRMFSKKTRRKDAATGSRPSRRFAIGSVWIGSSRVGERFLNYAKGIRYPSQKWPACVNAEVMLSVWVPRCSGQKCLYQDYPDISLILVSQIGSVSSMMKMVDDM